MLLKFDNFEIKLNLDKSETALKLVKLSSFKAQITTWDEERDYTFNTSSKILNNIKKLINNEKIKYYNVKL
jgi:hypothetical protein